MPDPSTRKIASTATVGRRRAIEVKKLTRGNSMRLAACPGDPAGVQS